MKLKTFLFCCALAMPLQHAAATGPTVSNVRAAQRAGTGLVDIYYDLSFGQQCVDGNREHFDQRWGGI